MSALVYLEAYYEDGPRRGERENLSPDWLGREILVPLAAFDTAQPIGEATPRPLNLEVFVGVYAVVRVVYLADRAMQLRFRFMGVKHARNT